MSFVGKAVSNIFGGGSSKTPKYEDKASQVTWDMYKRSLAEAKPYLALGKRRLPQYEAAAMEGAGLPDWHKPYRGEIEGLGGRLGLEEINQDPIFQWRLKTMQDELNKSLAGEGKLYSSMAPERYASVINQLTAEEADKTYARRFAELSTLYGMGQAEEQSAYERMLDAMKISTGASAQAGQYASSTGQSLSGLYGNLAGISAKERANTQELMSGLFGFGLGGWLG